MGCSIHLLLFTELLQEDSFRYTAGWTMIFLVLLNLLVNFALIIWDSLKEFCGKLKKFCCPPSSAKKHADVNQSS